MDAHLLLNTLKKEEDKKEKCVKEDTKKSLRDVCMRVCARVCARVYLCSGGLRAGPPGTGPWAPHIGGPHILEYFI